MLMDRRQFLAMAAAVPFGIKAGEMLPADMAGDIERSLREQLARQCGGKIAAAIALLSVKVTVYHHSRNGISIFTLSIREVKRNIIAVRRVSIGVKPALPPAKFYPILDQLAEAFDASVGEWT